jgi:hypothetical protein
MAERVGEDAIAAVTWLREWQQGRGRLKLGRMADQKWIAWHSRHGGWLCRDEREACDRCDRWMARGGWTEITQSTLKVSGVSLVGLNTPIATRPQDWAPVARQILQERGAWRTR